VADAGYFSENNVKACEERQIDPYMPPGRIHHHPKLSEQLAPAPVELPPEATEAEKMRAKLMTEGGKAIYKLSKQIVEPVFGIIKSILGFGQFTRYGVDNADSEWEIVAVAYNIKKLYKLNPTLN
jgi:hypothetical protein